MKDDYKKMYLHLFKAVTDALELLPEENSIFRRLSARERHRASEALPDPA